MKNPIIPSDEVCHDLLKVADGIYLYCQGKPGHEGSHGVPQLRGWAQGEQCGETSPQEGFPCVRRLGHDDIHMTWDYRVESVGEKWPVTE